MSENTSKSSAQFAEALEFVKTTPDARLLLNVLRTRGTGTTYAGLRQLTGMTAGNLDETSTAARKLHLVRRFYQPFSAGVDRALLMITVRGIQVLDELN